MDTTPTPPLPPADTAGSDDDIRDRGLRLRWRQLAADVADLLLVGLVGATASAAAYWGLGPPDPQAGLASLGFALLVLMIGTGSAAVAAIVVLAMAWRTRSPGDRLLQVAPHGGGLAAAASKLGRAVALQLAVTGLLAAADRFTAPETLAPVVAAASAATGVGLFVVVYAQQRDSVRWQRFATVAAVAGLLAAAGALGTPDRAPYPWEVRARVVEQLPRSLEELGGRRACARQGVPAGPSASHATQSCFDPDEVWAVPGPARTFARQLADRVRSDVGVEVDVDIEVEETLVGNDPAWEVVVDGRPQAHVVATDCGTRVRISGSANHPMRLDRFLPDVELAGRCA